MSLALEEGAASQLDKRELLKHKSTEELPKSCCSIVKKGLFYAKLIIDPQGPCANEIALTLCMTAAFLDPMFFYTRVINDDKRCISVEKSWGIAATLLRSVFDLFYIFHYTSTSGLINLYKTARVRFFMDLVAIFPLPQMVVILSMFQSTRKKCIWNALYVLIVQHALRSIRVATLLTERRTSATFSEWAAVFMLSYMYASHMFGALWYYTAIGRETELWEAGFKNLTGCTIHVPPYCDQTKYLKNACLKELDTAKYNYGIYKDAYKYGILNTTDYRIKSFYSFRWGLQNLSSFGQSLNTGTDFEENIYIISITLTGVLLFFFLIARMQVYLQSETIRQEEMKRKLKEIKQWKPFQKLSENLQRQVEEYFRQYAWQESKGVNLENLLDTLPDYLIQMIKQELCLELLQKVEEFGNWSEPTLWHLCDRVKPVFYIERTRIVREGDPIDEMFFVLQGELWTYTSMDHFKSENYHLKEGDFFGDELVSWARGHPPSANLPISTRTVKALTNVEAFVLMAIDLKDIFIEQNLELVLKNHSHVSSQQQ